MEDKRSKQAISDHLANERTFLAWVRTSIALMGLGFVVVKFSLFVKQFSIVVTGHPVGTTHGYSGLIGTGLVLVGALTTLFGYLRYRQTERSILDQDFKPQTLLLLLLTTGLIAISGLLLYYLLPNL